MADPVLHPPGDLPCFVHVHSLVPDGVFVEEAGGEVRFLLVRAGMRPADSFDMAKLRDLLAGHLDSAEDLAGLEQQLAALEATIVNNPAEDAMALIKESESGLGKIAGTSAIKSKLSSARRALKGNNPEPEKAIQDLQDGLQTFAAEVDWRSRASVEIAPILASYDNAIKESIGLRSQRRMPPEHVKAVASCLSVHRDYSLQF